MTISVALRGRSGSLIAQLMCGCLQSVDRDADGQVTRLEGHLHLDGDVKMTKLKLTWLADISDVVPLRLVDFDHLISKKKLEEGDDITDFVTPISVSAAPCQHDGENRFMPKHYSAQKSPSSRDCHDAAP